MKKLLFGALLSVTFLFSASPEQIEKYLDISNSDEELVMLESQFSAMQSSINAMSQTKSDEKSVEQSNYDMQLLSIRFKEKLQSLLSDDELDEILKNYNNRVLLQFVSATSDPDYDEKTAKTYVTNLEKNSEAKERIELVTNISKELYSRESMVILFDNLMKPMMKNAIGGDKMDSALMKESRESYVKMLSEASKIETIYSTREFTIEDLEELYKISKTSAIDHETKAVYKAMAYALKDFFLSMSSRYDIEKHKR